jgi:glycosyltransferase involved in cell wall biosynthesis
LKSPGLFSILLPLYNARDTFPSALNSVLKCQDSDIEIVVVDDGSDDGSGGMADTFASRDSRVRVIHSQHQGLVEALNNGMEQARGEWILRMDADDIAHPLRVKYYREYIATHPEVDIWGSLIHYFPRKDLKEGLIYYEQWVNSIGTHEEIVQDLFVECPIPHPTLACRRKDLVEVGGYCNNGMPEDYDLVFRLWERGKRFGKIPKRLLFWRDWNGRLSRTDLRYGIDRFMALKVSVLKRTLLKNRNAMVSAAGPIGKAFARELLAQGIKVVAFLEVDPDKIGNTVYGIPVWSVEKAREIGDALILHAVGQKGERQKGRELYLSWGLKEGKDFICVS